MDTFDTSEEVMGGIGIEATEVGFDENFEFGVNDQERENNNEQEDNIIDGEKGEKSTEDEKLEEKDPLMQCITENRGATGENSKLEIDKTISAESMRENIVNSGLSREQQMEELERLDNILTNPEQAHIFPDFIKETADTKITYFAALKVDGEGNVRTLIVSVEEKKEKPEEKPIDKVDGSKVEETTLNLELNINIDKQEEVDKETLLEQSLLTEIEAVNEGEVEQVEEIIQVEEQNFNSSEVHYADVEQVISVEETQSELISSEENVNVGNTHYVEQLAVDAKEDAEKVITERIIDLLKEEPQAKFVEEANTLISIAETEQNLKDAQERAEPLVVTVEYKTEKVQTLEDRIIELLRDEDELIEVVSEQIQTPEVENTQEEQVVLNIEDVENQAEINETVQVSHIESPVVVKGEEKIVVETKEKTININVGKVDNIKLEKVILTTDKDIKVANTRESKVVTKEAIPERVQVLNTKPEKKEAIVLNFNRNTVNNTTRNEARISLEKPKEEKRTTEESLKAKPLSGHEILLQILGISQNRTESRNAEPTNSRSVPNINQEEQETKSTKSIPSIYQPRNLNGITLKIAA